nr:ATP-binding protein [Nocardioides luti]
MPAHASLETVLQLTHEPLVTGFGASGTWLQLLDGTTGALGCARDRHGTEVPIADELVDLARCLAPVLWREQRVLVVSDPDDEDPTTTPGADTTSDPLTVAARTHLRPLGLATALAVPLGAGAECLGFLVLTRRAQDPPWSDLETSSALEIGHDLGTALTAAAALERERALVRELQQLDDYRTHLIATLSHELRTPLSVISGNLEMLGDLDLDRQDTEAARHHAAMVRGTVRMQRVVDDLLLLARVGDPQHPLDASPVDLAAVARGALALVESTARAKGLHLESRLDPTPVVVRGEPAELDRLVTNLVSNAAKYTPAGGTVTLSLARRGPDVVLEVADTGLGISEEDQAGLFRAFFRTTNPDALREPGTGLGLAIVATVAQRHGGDIRVRSRLGEGTTFTVVLPGA